MHGSSPEHAHTVAPGPSHRHALVRDVLRDLMAGTAGGIVGTTVGHPLDLIKTRLQTRPHYRGAFHCAMELIALEGPLAFFKGLSAPLMAAVVDDALMFSVNGVIRKMIQTEENQRLSLPQHMLSGALTGVCTSFILSPAELVKCRLQVQIVKRYTGSWDLARAIVKTEGMRGLMTGFGATLLREIPGNAAYFGTYRLTKLVMIGEDVDEQESLDVLPLLMAGGAAGTAYWLVSFPTDVIKSRIQTQSHNHMQYHGIVDCARQMYKTEGVAVFFRGLLVTLIRSFPVNAVTLLVYEAVMHHTAPE